jgi:hypothetical protein
MSAAQREKLQMAALLVSRGADVNAECWGWFPIIFKPCENLDVEALRWLLDHGANPNCARRTVITRKRAPRSTTLSARTCDVRLT